MKVINITERISSRSLTEYIPEKDFFYRSELAGASFHREGPKYWGIISFGSRKQPGRCSL